MFLFLLDAVYMVSKIENEDVEIWMHQQGKFVGGYGDSGNDDDITLWHVSPTPSKP